MGNSIDREKVIKGLQCCSHTDGINCRYCPYDNKDDDCAALMAIDVLALLKEQEAVVWCKDCKHYRKGTCSAGAGMAFPPPGDWFCADGEKR